MENRKEAYLDIETTSIQPGDGIITVIGIYLTDGIEEKFEQLIDEEITYRNLLNALEGADIIYTYNGTKFDLPFIKEHIGIDLGNYFQHRDLMYDCLERGLYGGLKKIEEILGIERETAGINGEMAVKLWERYKAGDRNALEILLKYNREDVMALKILKEILFK